MAANTGILTTNGGLFLSALNYYSPSATVPTTGKPLAGMYCFLSRVEPWANESVPPVPTQSQKDIKSIFKNMFVAKQVTTNDISLVVERIDWKTGEIYAYYRDDIDLYALEPNGTLIQRFYVKNKFDQVFKCLWNNNGAASTEEPSFEPGNFNSNLVYQGSDGYKWKYIYTITGGNKLKFMDDTWMPVPLSNVAPNPIQSTKTYGSIDAINIVTTGSNYSQSNAPVSIVITGDGYAATANAVISSGQIVDITVANTGYGYTYANVSITSAQGSGATAVAYPSPVGGHGFNPAAELGARHAMITAKFTGSESGNLPTDIDFRQVGILVNPLAYFGSSYAQANASIYKLTTDFIVSQGFGDYSPDETVFQSVDGQFENAYFKATVLSFDSTFNTLKVINTFGEANTNVLLIGNTTQTSRVALQKQDPSLIPLSGYITYIENREAVQRDPDGSEQFKLVLGF